MSRFVLLITDLTAVHNEIACHARGVRLVTREPHQLTRHDWDSAGLVLVDAQTAPILRAQPELLPHRDAVTLLVDPEDQAESDMYRHTLDLGASHLVTVPDGTGALRTQISMMAESPRMVVAILDPAPPARPARSPPRASLWPARRPANTSACSTRDAAAWTYTKR